MRAQLFRESTAFLRKFWCGKGGGRIGGKQNHRLVEHRGICDFAICARRFGTVGKHPGNVAFKIRTGNDEECGGECKNKQSPGGERTAELRKKNMT